MAYPRVDETGNTYGRLKVLRQGTTNKFGRACWVCACDCGNQVEVPGTQLRKGESRSCGCGKSERLAARVMPMGD